MPLPPLKKITDLGDLTGKTVFVRGSLNVPIVGGVVQNQFRVTRGLATLNTLINKGARIVLAGHIGSDGVESTAPIAELLKQHGLTAYHVAEVTGAVVKNALENLKPKKILVLENLRRDPREKQNDDSFARELAELADIYVNDAFPASHRVHASICAITKLLPGYIGHNFNHELTELTAMRSPKSPSLFMLGGAKFDTKMPLVEQFLEIYDHVFIGGALANDLFKARGYEVGTSLVSAIDVSNNPVLQHPKLLMPVDVIVSGASGQRVTTPDQVHPDEKIFDAGPKTLEMLAGLISGASSILWNGPFGNYEAGFSEQTLATARLLAATKGTTVVGGGDTVASIEELLLQEKFTFLSTAGGAMLTFLELGTLPAIEALLQSEKV